MTGVQTCALPIWAAEALVQRTFAALGLKGDEDINSRVAAVRLWQMGKVVVK